MKTNLNNLIVELLLWCWKASAGVSTNQHGLMTLERLHLCPGATGEYASAPATRRGEEVVVAWVEYSRPTAPANAVWWASSRRAGTRPTLRVFIPAPGMWENLCAGRSRLDSPIASRAVGSAVAMGSKLLRDSNIGGRDRAGGPNRG